MNGILENDILETRETGDIAQLKSSSELLNSREEALRKSSERFRLLSDLLAQLLSARDPDAMVRELFPKVAAHVGADTYFNYMVNEAGDALTLHAYAGVSEATAKSIYNLAFGQAICGTVAQFQTPMYVTDLQSSHFKEASLTKSFGLACYACNPLLVGDRLLGTLSFASRKRTAFDEEELEFLRMISHYTAIAIERLHSAEALEKKIEERTSSLREANAQLEEFSYTISHDLRAPLRGVQIYSDALIEDFGETLPEKASQWLQRISKNMQLLDKMILDVLTFSRVARSEQVLEKVDLSQLVSQILEQYPNLQAPAAEVEIAHLPEVLGHGPSLTQAVSNLLNNAVKFVAPGVTPRVRIWPERHNGAVRIWIQDNGIGIHPQHQNRLFNMFERIQAASTYEGTGVGLAIVRKAVERMGGQVGLESDGTSGSRFWFEVKASD